MNLEKLSLSREDIAELSEPFGPKHAMEALRMGFASGLSELGLLPSEFEEMLKSANFKEGTLGELFNKGVEGYGNAAALVIGAGALGGAYSGYARARLDQMIAGNDDPEAVALRKKTQAYQSMIADLKRTNQLQAAPQTV